MNDGYTRSDPFLSWWQCEAEWVEPPNQRRHGWSGMCRVQGPQGVLYLKRQLNHRCYTLRHPLGWPTVSREYHYLCALRALGLGAPEPVFHGVRRVEGGLAAVLVTRELAGFSDLAAHADLNNESKHLLAGTLGHMLGIMHARRLQHSSLYDKHIMVRHLDGVFTPALIDLEKMRPRLSRKLAARHDLEQLFRRQKVFDAGHWQTLVRAHERGAGISF